MTQDIERADRPSPELERLIAEAIYEGFAQQEETGDRANLVAGLPRPCETTWLEGYFYLLPISQIVFKRLKDSTLRSELG